MSRSFDKKLEMEHKEVSCWEVRDCMAAYIECRRDATSQPVPMDIGNQKGERGTSSTLPIQGAAVGGEPRQCKPMKI